MSDPLLTSLCGICHIRSPKYKCPRCGARTCSLPCIKKHKNWSSCSGERDPTVFVPAAKLRTDAGIDHDYNFLTKIERSVEQVEKIFTEERGILPERKPEPPPNKKARLGKGKSRGKNTIGDSLRPWARLGIHRLSALNISVLHQPYGMSRSKENTTSFNKRTGSLNWQVEWLFLDPSISPEQDEKPRPTRFLNKMLDTTPLYVGYAESREKQRLSQLSQTDREKEKKQAAGARQHKEQASARDDRHSGWENSQTAQNAASFKWRDAPRIAQNPTTGCWNITRDQGGQKWDEGIAEKERGKYRFFFHIPGTPSREAQKLVPLAPTDTLESALKNREVLEFPAIYVLPVEAQIPHGFVLEERTKVVAKGKEKPQKVQKVQKAHKPQKPQKTAAVGGKKRKSSVLVEYGSSEDEEEGEVREEGEAEGSDGGFEFDDKEKLAEFQGGLEEDDETSSSGSDSSEMDVD